MANCDAKIDNDDYQQPYPVVFIELPDQYRIGLGFSQALFLAGADSVVLSLWKVDDTATSLLMSRFYANLLGTREGLAKPLGKKDRHGGHGTRREDR